MQTTLTAHSQQMNKFHKKFILFKEEIMIANEINETKMYTAKINE